MLQVPGLPSPTLKRETSGSYDHSEATSNAKYERYHPVTISPPMPSSKFVYMSDPEPHLEAMDFANISFTTPKRMTFGWKVDVLYKGKPISFQTPQMCCTFGLNTYKNARGNSKVMELDFWHRDRLSSVNEFYKTCRMLDKFLLDKCIQNRDRWVPQLKKSRVADKDLWQKFVGITRMRESKDGQLYQPRFTAKIWDDKSMLFLPAWSSEGDMEDEEESVPFTEETVTAKTWVVTSVVCTGLWLCKDSLSTGWRIDQSRIVEAPSLGPGSAAEPTKRKLRLVKM